MPGIQIKHTMKKFIAVASVILTVLLSGCRKEEKSLAGTRWTSESGTETLSFTSVKASLSTTEDTFYYSYEYNDPIVILTPENSEIANLKGIVDKNQMTLINTSVNQTVGIFIPKH